ncbi:MAG TPA: hypothetical protein VIH99_13375 [Bdellovibrionota bacterium]|jgi:hypothetical protein
MLTLRLSALCALATLILTASPAEAAGNQAETCSKLEKMLLSVQLRAPNMESSQYEYLNDNLKESYARICDSKDAFSAEDAVVDAVARQTVRATYHEGEPIEVDGRWYLPDGNEFVEPSESEFERMVIEARSSRGSPKVLGLFLPTHRSCAPGCSYVSWGIWGDKAHQARRSCHNSGQAIDIHAITCGGRTYKVLSPRFDQYVSCMRSRMGAIYRSKDHFDHAHFQIPGCNKCRGLGCGT